MLQGPSPLSHLQLPPEQRQLRASADEKGRARCQGPTGTRRVCARVPSCVHSLVLSSLTAYECSACRHEAAICCQVWEATKPMKLVPNSAVRLDSSVSARGTMPWNQEAPCHGTKRQATGISRMADRHWVLRHSRRGVRTESVLLYGSGIIFWT